MDAGEGYAMKRAIAGLIFRFPVPAWAEDVLWGLGVVPVELYEKKASTFTQRDARGKKVWIEFDQRGADRYGRRHPAQGDMPLIARDCGHRCVCTSAVAKSTDRHPWFVFLFDPSTLIVRKDRVGVAGEMAPEVLFVVAQDSFAQPLVVAAAVESARQD
jgi:hypothetical protein